MEIINTLLIETDGKKSCKDFLESLGLTRKTIKSENVFKSDYNVYINDIGENFLFHTWIFEKGIAILQLEEVLL